MTETNIAVAAGAGLPDSQGKAVTVAREMIERVTGGFETDPMDIKRRARAAEAHCEALAWTEARGEYAYLAMCCDFMWHEQNPRGKHGTNQHSRSSPGELLPKSTASKIHDAFEGVDRADLESAKARADAEGRRVTRADLKPVTDPQPQPTFDRNALWVCGRMREFERDGYLEMDYDTLVERMTQPMKDDMRRLVPRVKEWLKG